MHGLMNLTAFITYAQLGPLNRSTSCLILSTSQCALFSYYANTRHWSGPRDRYYCIAWASGQLFNQITPAGSLPPLVNVEIGAVNWV